MKRKKRLLIIIAIAAAAAVLALAVFGTRVFWQAARYGEAVLEDVGHSYQQTPSLGKLVNLEVNCVLPWGQYADQIGFIPGEGIIPQGSITTRNTHYTAHGRVKTITIPLKSSRPGKLEIGSLQVEIDRNLHSSAVKKQTLTKKLPAMEFTALKVTNPDQLPLAGAAIQQADSRKHYWYWLVGVLSVIIIAGAFFIWLQKRRMKFQQEILPPWVIAQRNLDELRKTADAGKQPLEWCVVKLSDVVREYLSIRFCWKVKQQTTEEFFASLKRKNSPLTASQTFYLEEFMKQSDLIKFANIKPDKDSFTLAVDRAEDLVKQTGKTAESENQTEHNEVKK